MKVRFDNFNTQTAAIKAYFLNKIYELKNEMARLKQRVKDQDNGMPGKAKLSLLEYENSFFKRRAKKWTTRHIKIIRSKNE